EMDGDIEVVDDDQAHAAAGRVRRLGVHAGGALVVGEKAVEVERRAMGVADDEPPPANIHGGVEAMLQDGLREAVVKRELDAGRLVRRDLKAMRWGRRRGRPPAQSVPGPGAGG